MPWIEVKKPNYTLIILSITNIKNKFLKINILNHEST